jgi:hypothetical protein
VQGIVSFDVSNNNIVYIPANNLNALYFPYMLGSPTQLSYVCYMSGLTGGSNTFTLKYKSAAAGFSNSFANRRIIVQAI